jgi:hypothetical protein
MYHRKRPVVCHVFSPKLHYQSYKLFFYYAEAPKKTPAFLAIRSSRDNEWHSGYHRDPELVYGIDLLENRHKSDLCIYVSVYMYMLVHLTQER